MSNGFVCPDFANPWEVVRQSLSVALAPRPRLKTSEWADRNFKLSSKGSSEPGQWRTSRNELLRKPMDSLSSGSRVRSVTLMFPIQLGKTEIARVVVGYRMTQRPGPIMVMLPSDVSREKWSAQKLQPMIDECETVKAVLTSVSSREAANSKFFKDFIGGQLYLEHAGSPARAKSTSVELMIVDEYDAMAKEYTGGDDPGLMLEGRVSAFPDSGKFLFISSPTDEANSRIYRKFMEGDQQYRYLPCPHCGEMQHLVWGGLRWTTPTKQGEQRKAWYVCKECGTEIQEHHKTRMLAKGEWRPHNPGAQDESYTTNCLYYPAGLGPTWAQLATMWVNCQEDPAALRVFVNDRLAEVWRDASTRNVHEEAIFERSAVYKIRTAPAGVLYITAGVDTQDDRLACQLVGWGRGMRFWVLDYVEIPGDPAGDDVWLALAKWLLAPVEHEIFGAMRCDAMWQDAGGHRTHDVYAWNRRARSLGITRPMCGFGAKAANADVLGRPTRVDYNWRGTTEKSGVAIRAVGTIAAKDWFFARLAQDGENFSRHAQAMRTEDTDAKAQDRAPDYAPMPVQMCNFTQELESVHRNYFAGLVSEAFNPKTGRYEKKRGAKRNEPLDTWGYAFAAAHHPELRLNRLTPSAWNQRETELLNRKALAVDAKITAEQPGMAESVPKPIKQATQPKPANKVPARWQ